MTPPVPFKVEVRSTPHWLKIYVNDFLHLLIDRVRLVGIQSYVDEHFYCLEFTTQDTVITCEYNVSAKWKAILLALDKAKLFDT